MTTKYHAFLSYNSSIYGELASIYDDLMDHGLNVFLDRKCVPLGVPCWRREIDRALEVSDSVLVVVGPNGSGPWREAGNYAFQRIAVTASHRLIIPVFLPGASQPADYPSFLDCYHRFAFKSSVREEISDLMRLLPGEMAAGGHTNPLPEEDKDGLSASTRRFYEANEEIYLNRWRHGVPPEVYSWLFAFVGRK